MIISNQIVTTFLARGGQAIAQHGQVAASFLNIGRAARTSGNEISLAEKQMRAFGTTVRYAFAGSVLFGMTSMIGKLNELQQQMGLIAAISRPAGARGLTGNWLSNMQDEIASSSADARTNVTDLNNAAINFLSTVQGANIKDVPDIVAQLGITARLSQTPTEELTKSLTTLDLAAGRQNNMKNLNGLMRQWFHLISTAPGAVTAAPQIAQQLGPLGAVLMGLGPATPEQIMGLTLGSLKFGATPSVALRGLQYFTQSLMQPPSKEAAEAQAAAGFTPERLAREGPTKVILDFLRYVRNLGGGSNITKTGISRLTTLGLAGDVSGEEYLAPNVNIPGLSPEALAFLRTSIGRIHGIRTAAVLMRQLDPNDPILPSIDELIKQFYNLNNNIGSHADDLKKAADDYRAATPLQGAAIALDSLRSNVARDLGIALNPASRAAQDIAGGLTGNAGLRHTLEIAAIGGLGLMGLRSVLGRFGGRLPGGRIFGKIPGLGRLFGGGSLGQGVVGSMAMRDFAAHPGERGMTPALPLYVTVVGQIFGGNRGPNRGGPGLIAVGGTGAAEAAGVGLGATAAAATFAVAAVLASKGATRQEDRSALEMLQNPSARNQWPTIIENFGSHKSYVRKNFPGLFKKVLAADTPEELTRLEGVLKSALRAEREREKRGAIPDEILRTWNKPGGMFQAVGIHDGELLVNIKLTTPDGKIHQKRVPLSAGAYKNGKVPTVRGRKKSVRADFPIEAFPDWFGFEGRPRK